MTYEEQNLKSLFARIGVVMVIFVSLINLLYGGAGMLKEVVITMFPHSVLAYCLTDLLASAGYFLSFFFPVLIFYAISRNAGARPVDFSLRLPPAHTTLKTMAIIFGSLSIILAMAYVNSMLFPNSGMELSGGTRMAPYQLVLMVFSTAVVPAFCEELLFRGVFLSNLRLYGKNVAVVVSALMFAFMHMNAAQLLYAFAAGIVFGLVYYETGSLWIGILLHFLNNFFNVLESYLFEILPTSKANMICLIVELTIFLLGIILTAVYFAVRKREEQAEKSIGVFGRTDYVSERSVCLDSRRTVRLFIRPSMVVFVVLSVLNMLVYWLWSVVS